MSASYYLGHNLYNIYHDSVLHFFLTLHHKIGNDTMKYGTPIAIAFLQSTSPQMTAMWSVQVYVLYLVVCQGNKVSDRLWRSSSKESYDDPGWRSTVHLDVQIDLLRDQSVFHQAPANTEHQQEHEHSSRPHLYIWSVGLNTTAIVRALFTVAVLINAHF